MKEKIYNELLADFQMAFPKQIDDIKSILIKRLIGYKTIEEENLPTIQSLFFHFNKCFGDQVITRKRELEIYTIRHYFFYECKQLFKNRYSLKYIGSYQQQSPYDHTSVIHAINTIKKYIDKNDQLVLSTIQKWEDYKKNTFGI